MFAQLEQSSLDTRERHFCTRNKAEARGPTSQLTVFFFLLSSTYLSSLPTVDKQRCGMGDGGSGGVWFFSPSFLEGRERFLALFWRDSVE